MKKLLVLIFCVTCFFVIGVKAQEYPEIVGDEDSYTLTLPYVEFEDGEGEKKALSIELVASKADSELSFLIVESSLLDVEVDTPTAVSGEGACSRTTNAQLLACRADVQDDFFELQANCFNYGDADEQQECFLDAETERLEGVGNVMMLKRNTNCSVRFSVKILMTRIWSPSTFSLLMQSPPIPIHTFR